MKKLFHRGFGWLGGNKSSSTELDVHLAAFGKHPGWDDHLPGIGLNTELLARIKQFLYVNGIGGQIDSGGWEKLDAAKRLPGFEHIFLGLFGSQVVLGCFWSSSDRLGRAKYPMVLCLQLNKFSPAGIYQVGWPILETLKNQCRQLKTQEEVNGACARALAELQAVAQRSPETIRNLKIPLTDRRNFLESPNLGQDRSGFLRVFHELDLAGSAHASESSQAGKTNHRQSHFSRMPVPQMDSGFNPLVIWAEFLRCSIPAETPIFLLQKSGANWVDAVIGEASGEEFFCLQASPQALPLATEVPYDLPAGLKRNFELIQEKFLNLRSSDVVPASIAPTTSSGGKPVGGSRSVYLMLGGLVVVLIAVAWVVFYSKDQPSSVEKPLAKNGGGMTNSNVQRAITNVVQKAVGMSSNAATSNAAIVAAAKFQNDAVAAQPDRTMALQAGLAALDSSNYDEAIRQAAVILGKNPGDPEGVKLNAAAELGKQATAAAVATASANDDQNFSSTLMAGQKALQSGNFEEAVSQAVVALRLKPGNASATKLQADATSAKAQFAAALKAGQQALQSGNYAEALRQSGLALQLKPDDLPASKLKEYASSENKYALAIVAGNDALKAKNYDEATRQAGIALNIKTGDDAATKLKEAADTGKTAALRAAENESKYQAAIMAGKAALAGADYNEAIQQAGMALNIKAGDDAAMKLKEDAATGKAVAQMAAENNLKFNAALQAGQAALASGDFNLALTQVKIAQTINPTNLDLAKLLVDAQNGQDLKAARAAYDQGDFQRVNDICAKHPGDPAFAVFNRQVTSGGHDVLDARVEALMVKFGLKSVKDAKSELARATQEIGGQLRVPERAAYLNEVENLRQQLKHFGWLTPEADKNLDSIKSAITSL